MGIFLVALVGPLCGACGSSGGLDGHSSASTTSTSSGTTSSRPGGSAVTTVPAHGEVSVDEHAKGTSVNLSVGQTLLLELHSTYWQDVTSSDPSVLRAMSPTVTPQPASSSCPPGSGCGSVTVQFVALAPGTATVSANRQLCGEDVQCPASDRAYTLQVKIAG